MRYFICKIVGTGQRGDSYRPEIPGSALIPSHGADHPAYGHPKFTWCLVRSREKVSTEGRTPVGEEVTEDAQLQGQPVGDATLKLLQFYGLATGGDALDVLNRVRTHLA